MEHVKLKFVRGILFSLSLTTLALAVVSLALLFFTYTYEIELSKQQPMTSERVYQTYNEVEHALSLLFFNYSGVDVELTNTTFSYLENLPNKKAENFKTQLTRYSLFLGNHSPHVNIKTSTLIHHLPIILSPHDAWIYHPSYGTASLVAGGNLSSLHGYFVSILWSQNLSSCESITPPGSMTFNVTLNVTGANNTCFISRLVDPEENNVFRFNGGELKIIINNTGNFSLNLQGESELRLNLTFELTPSSSTLLSLPTDTIKVEYSEFNLTRIGGVRLLYYKNAQ